MTEYPEHKKLKAVQELSQACADFLDWLGEQGIWLARYDTVSDVCRNCEHDAEHPWTGGCAATKDNGMPCKCTNNDRGNPDRLFPVFNRKDELLAEHFQIDLKVLEQEKQAMLDAMRQMNKQAAIGDPR